MYYKTATSSYALVPDSALTGNAAGFTNSPISISSLDKNVYGTLKLDAELICSSGICPSIQDWSLEWSEGLTVSGTALEYDQLTNTASGTIAVAVNGVLQVGKTAQIASGTTTQQVVFSTAGTSTFTVPAGVTNVTVKAWGAGGGAGAGGNSDGGGAGGGAGFVQGSITVIPGENLTVFIGGGGGGGTTGLPTGAGGGGGYSGITRTSTPLSIAAGGGGGGGGTGGIRYVSAGANCAVNGATCSPGIPATTAVNDVYIAVLNSRTNTAHTCTTNCTGWTEFSTQAGSLGEGRLSVWYYRQTGAVPLAPVFGGPATDTYTGRIWAFRGVTTSGNPYDVLGTNTAITTATTTFAGSNLTSTVPDAMTVFVGGSMDDNTWGPASGACTIPTTADVNFYNSTNLGTDNSLFLCYKSNPFAATGQLGTPINSQATVGPDAGRYFTFALKPEASSIAAPGSGGVGGGVTGTPGANASSSNGGGAGTQSAGGSIGGGNATVGLAYTGGNGSTGTGGGAGGAGGINGGGTGGAGASTTIDAAGGGGGAGYFGGGGGASAAGVYLSGAGGGGGSSFIATAASATSTVSGSSTLAGSNTDPDYSTGVGVGATRSATSTSGSAGNPGRVVVTWTTAASPGAWSIPNVAAFVGDTVTVFMQNASGTDEAVGVTTYDGAGDISGMQLSKRHLTIGSNDTPIVTNAQLGLYANGVNEDIFFSTSAGNTISLCAEATCSDAQLRILSGSTYTPGANSSVINFQNNGTFAPATNTLRVSGLWQQLGTFTPELSTVIFTATTSSTTLTNATTTHTFYNVTFGETSGSAVWNMAKPLITLGNLVVSQGTLARGTSTINIAGNLNLGTNGFLSGLATTTFDGTGSNTWGDAKGSTLSTNMGNVVIDGSSKTITLSDNVGAQTLTIGGDDTLNSSGSGFNINIVSAWTNNSLFIPQTGTVTFVGTSIGVINRGTSAFNNLTFSGVGGIWSFSTSTLVLNGNLTIATGTVTLPIGTTTIGGSFLNTGGTFAHNNGEVRMTSNSAGRTITQRATAFLNAFYDLVFTGSGSWSFNESAATTTRNFSIQSGTVTHPSGTLTVGGDYTVSGSGAFAHNNGEVLLLVSGQNIVSSNGSSFNNLRTRSVGVVNPRIRTFTDTNATILGNLTLEATADMVFPSGILSIGGSLANAADFTANNGTVRFNSTAGAETIAAGTSTFATLEFNNAGGIFTVTQNATATVAINLTNASAFTLQSGLTLSALGSFTNAANGSSTTWTGSILSLSGLDGAINLKSHGGDAYATILTNGDTDMIVWNSTATTYTTASSSSIYSADHAGVDGKLNIYGDYIRSTGTEFWSFATDFDGAALTGSTSRQVDVRIASSSRVGFTSASLNLVGSTLASTTIDALAGSYALSATSSTITAQNFTVAGTNVSGLQLWASTTLATFQDGFFTVVPGRSGITMSSTTVANNPSAQYQRIGFATTTAGAGINVTLVGTTSAFVWFRNGAGNLYGEDFDGADANPGSIRWDDSSNSIVISGVVYSDDGVTPLSSPTCDGVTPNVQVVVNSGSFTASTSCAVGTGAYSFASVNYLGDPKITVYLNTNGGVAGSVVTKTPTANITNMHIYANRVITRHQDVLPLTASDMQTFDFDNDSDLRFIAATTSLILLPNTELFVFASTTFAPGGNITLQGNGNANGYEGTLQIGPNATFNASSTETHTLAGRFVMATTSTFTAASSTFIFNATTTGKSITAPNTVTFNQLQFNGLGGGWNITAPLSVLADMHVATGTVTGTSNITLQNGSLYGNGVLSLGSGTTTINRTSTLGGTSAWTFNNLVLGSGLIVGTTTPASSATTTISGRLTISNAHFLNAGSAQFDLSGTGNVFVNNGTFITGTSLIRYSGNNATILGSNYYNLTLSAIAGSSTFTGTATGINVLNNLTIGGLASTTMTLLASDPVLAVGNNLTIATSGTFVASDIATTTIAGSYANTGTLISSGGRLTFIGSGTQTIAAGNSSFANITISGTGNFNVTQNATSTGSFVLDNHNNFTVTSSRTLALGGTFTNSLGSTTTTFTGSTLSFFGGGDRSINASTTSDTYDTIAVASGTNVRMWNSSAGTYTGPGGIYSQKHSGTNGLLNIYGNLTSTSANDYWSYATDFDGTSLIGGNERIANVRFASGTTATYSGGSLTVIGTSSATTTLQNQGSGTYGITIGTGATTNWNAVNIRNTNINGVVFAGAPIVTDFSRTDHLVQINGGTAITVGGTVINANEAKNFTNNIFASSSGVTGTINVTATGTSVSSWRFTNHTGNIAGEAFDSDPAGDPGYLVWDNSAALVTVAGNVYSDEAVTTSPVCDGATPNIRLVVAGLTTYDTTCNAVTGAYSIAGIAFSPLDTLTLYINGNARKAANVTVAPISSISNMNLYENRVIVRHENTSPITIANMAVWDSSDDADIQFTAVDAGSDTLTLPANNKLIIWTGKTFEPNGNVTLSGAGAGADFDGTLEAQTNAVFRAKTTETHSIGGSVLFGTGAVFTSASSTLTLTTTGSSRTFDVNANNVHNLTITGSGSYAMTDATLTLGGSYTQSNGAVTLPTGTTTIGAAFNVTGGTFNNNGGWFVFNGSGAGNTVRFNNSLVGPLTFSGSGSFNLTDLNATSTGFVLITAGTVTLPSGNFAVGGSFRKTAGTLTHNTSDIIMTATTSALLTASGSDLFAVRFIGAGPFTMTDSSITLLDSLEIASGTVALASTTTSVAGSFTATGGTFTTGTGTILLNSSVAGRTVNPGVSSFYNLQFGAPAGGYTLMTSTTTNNFTISNISSLLVNPGAVVAVGGIFTNSIGGATTTWTNTTLALNAAANYSINSRLNSGDTYGTLVIGANANVRSWYSNAATTTVNNSSSLYSQDHGNANGALNIFGNLTIATSTEYWSYARDFDGTLLSGVERSVTVGFAQNATTTVTSGELQIIGALGQVTTVQNQGTSTYTLAINGGTLNANYYRFSNLNASGLQLLGLSTITDLANGLYDLAVNSGSLVTLSSTTLNANPAKIFNNVGFTATTGLSGTNINLTGSTSNAWRFTNSYGNIGGEAFDNDGIDACGSIRFDNSSCLLTEQTNIRWRNNNGGEGATNSEWFNQSFGYRKRVRVVNADALSYATTAIKVTVAYDSDMQTNFADLRFTTGDGLTIAPHFIEKVTASTEAIVWVKVQSLPATDTTNLFMYYASSTATTTSSGTSTFAAIDDFEDNNISEYSGDNSLFQTDTTPVYGGSYALEAQNKTGRTTNGLYRSDLTTAQGQIIRWMQYVSTDGDDACTLFGFQSVSSNYALCLQRFGVDRMVLAKNVKDIDSSGTVLSSTTVTYATGWYEVEVDWRTNNSITAYLYNGAGSLVASTTATDSSYTSGGIGYTFWINNGSWDSYTTRPAGPRRPTVFFGAEQTSGGATWLAAQNAIGNALPGNTLRLRLAIENSGLEISGQQFRLEYAAKGVAPTCESVSSGSFVSVPNQASCGSSPVCMQTSGFVSDGADTTDLLEIDSGTFTSGKMVLSPSNQTSALTIAQRNYTELEYALTPTVNASDSYCFRVTNAGTPLDYYNKVAELGLQFDPTITALVLNGSTNISLTPGTTTPVTVTATVNDFNGYTDITRATTTIYRSGAGAACTPNNNNCYIASTQNGKCSFTSCSGSTCQLSCQVGIFFHADPTDISTYSGEEWLAYAEVEDAGAGYNFSSAVGVELITLRALQVGSAINYGSLEANTNTGSSNATSTITNLGNVPINVDVAGTNLTDGGSSIIPTNQQKMATSTFTYSSCVSCLQLSSSSPVTLGINLTKPTVDNPPVNTNVYWGIAVPFGINSAPHSGVNVFTAIGI